MKWLLDLLESHPADRRRGRRLSGPVELRVLTASRHALPADLCDLSEGGLKFRVRAPLGVRHEPVAIYLRSGSREQTLPIEVLRSETGGRDERATVAARFTKPQPEAVELVGAARRLETRQRREAALVHLSEALLRSSRFALPLEARATA